MSSVDIMQGHCRCCLIKNKSNAYYVFGTLAEFKSKICELITNCTGVTITEDDPFSKNICPNCLSELIKATRFRIRSARSQDILLSNKMLLDTDFGAGSNDKSHKQLLKTLNELTKAQLKVAPLPVKKTKNKRKKTKVVSNTDQMAFPCLQCDRRFSSRAAVSVHMRKHPKIPCNTCGVEFHESDLAIHQEQHPKEQETPQSTEGNSSTDILPFVCKPCGKGFTSIELLKVHKRVHSGNIFSDTPRKCEFCGRKFVTISRYLLHMRTHAEVDQCQKCGKTFHSKIKFRRHKCKPPRKHPFQCSICKEVLQDDIGLRRHRSTHVIDRPFECEYCDKAFIQKRNLMLHMRYHTGEDTYRCEICDKRFIYMHRFQQHMEMHNNPNKTAWECTLCSREFKVQTELNRHMRWHNGELPYDCSSCDKSFREQRQLVKHERIHTGEKPFQCDLCGKAFHCSNILTKHRARHDNPTLTYECDICGNVFTRANYLAFHRKKHFKSVPNDKMDDNQLAEQIQIDHQTADQPDVVYV
ncbi:zinc finger protein 883-like isoform X2 [Malaya genurostris]|uniref:zinc finger protein 883-like isoform X2 n=1 Tax=Malaya genurostris TaxID=325434 RepID=UPI0026F3D6A2|nr:zinc finger protein 883-like isoform X2 [Malaya genurostris]